MVVQSYPLLVAETAEVQRGVNPPLVFKGGDGQA